MLITFYYYIFFGHVEYSLYLCFMIMTDTMTQGYDSFFDGLSIDTNPYRVGTIKYNEWMKGYFMAKVGE